MKRFLHRLHSQASGFTIVELLMAMTIGVVVLGSATLITIGAAKHNNEVAQRTDASARGRYAMDRMTQLIRSQVCASATTPPITDARADSITLTSDLGDGTAAKPIQRNTFTYDLANRRLLNTRAYATGTNTFGTATTSEMASNTDPVGTSAIFRYYAYPNPLPTSGVVTPNVELVPPVGGTLDDNSRTRIARVDLHFVTTGATLKTRNIRAEQTNQVFVRLADPDGGSADPTCT